MQKLYCISGLGADERAFTYLHLPGVEIIHLHWLVPHKKETMQAYAKRMADCIKEDNAVLLGLSFGGMMSVEIGKIKTLKKIILVSSCKTKYEVPPYFKLGRLIPIHKIFPFELISKSDWLLDFFFGARSKLQKEILKEIIKGTTPGFNKWAVNSVINWKNTIYDNNIVHLHGNKDKLLPYRFVQADYTIEGGTHYMIVTKAREISKIVLKEMGLA